MRYLIIVICFWIISVLFVGWANKYEVARQLEIKREIERIKVKNTVIEHIIKCREGYCDCSVFKGTKYMCC